MNMRAHELVSGYIAGIANSDTEFHIKYAPYTFFGITIHLSLYAMNPASARGRGYLKVRNPEMIRAEM